MHACTGMEIAMIRLILVVLFLIIYYIFSLPMFLVGWIIGKVGGWKKQALFSDALVVGAFHVILFLCGTKVTKYGLEHVRQDGPALYVFNHRSYFDILLGYTTGPKLMGYISKNDLEHVPLISRWMRYMKCLFLDRDDMKKGLKTILEGIELLKEGHSLYIAPEGTRNHGTEMLEFHEASFKLASKAKVPVIPVAIHCSDDIWENHLPWLKGCKVSIEYGEPFYIDDLPKEDRKKVGALTRDKIQKMLDAHGPQ